MSLLHAAASFAHSPLFLWRSRVSFCVLHLDHLTRAGESTKDAELVSSCALDWGLPILHAAWNNKASVAKTAGEKRSLVNDNQRDKGRGSFQDKASRWRRSMCRRVAMQTKTSAEHDPDLFVTAHHAMDRAEGILQNIIRGASPGGLVGLTPINHRERLLRPMLKMSRQQIDDYVHEQSLPFRHDSSNDDMRYRRNAVRHRIMPLLKDLNPAVVEAINRLGDSMAHLLDTPTAKPHDDSTTTTTRASLRNSLANGLKAQNPDAHRTLTQNQLDNLVDHVLCNQRTGRTMLVNLAKDWQAVINHGIIDIYRVRAANPAATAKEVQSQDIAP